MSASSDAVEPLGPVEGPAEKVVVEEPAAGLEAVAQEAAWLAEPEAAAPMAALAAEAAVAAPLVWEEALGRNLYMWDDTYVPVPIGFPFTFYGNRYDSLFVGSNGYLTFGQGGSAYSAPRLPNWGGIPMIAASFTDWWPFGDSSNNVYVNLVGDAPHRRLVVTWWQLPGFRDYPPGPNSFQIQIFEGSNKIQFGYKELYSPWSHPQATGLDSGTGMYLLTATAAEFRPGREKRLLRAFT